MGRAIAVPNCNTVGEDALDGAVVEVHQDLRGQMNLFKSPQKEEPLVSLLDQGRGIKGPREVLRDVDTLEAGNGLHLIPMNVNGGGGLGCPQPIALM